MNRELVSLALALQFLTRLPINVGRHYSPELFARSVRFYPLAGAFIGALGAVLYTLSAALLPHEIAVLCAVVGLLMVTGAFHEDGLADSFDGLGGGLDRTAKLRIMRDSRLGTYGTLAVVSTMAMRTAVLMALPPSVVPWALILAQSISRLSSVIVIASSTYVRDEGTGKPVAQTMDGAALVFALSSGGALVLAASAVLDPAQLCMALLGLAVGHAVLRRWIENQIGGYTGDTLGAIQQISELGFLIGLLAWH
ncbi:MAG: adenosylcobinamide-GDP ribazoletransferase [Pseudomonadota bacterium]